jgi:hypothetical protein
MEFFIKKGATLPVLKINVIKDGRSDYNRSMKFLSETDVFFSMVDTQTNIPRITTRPAGLMSKIAPLSASTSDYYVYYQFTPFDTKKVGRYKGQFLFRDDTGILVLPLNEEIYINVTDSFILDDMEFQSCYVVDYPCCTGFIPTPPGPVPPGPTTTSTTIPLTSTTTIPATTTTSTQIPCVVCISGATLPPINQTRTYNGITLSGSGSGFVSGSMVPTIPTCYSNWESPILGTTFLGNLGATTPSPFSYDLSFSQNVNNIVLRLINYSGFPPLYRETFTFTLFQDETEVPLTINPCEYCCAILSGNTILATDGSVCQNGSGIFSFESEISYNRIRIEGPGGGGGTFLDVCEDSVIPI